MTSIEYASQQRGHDTRSNLRMRLEKTALWLCAAATSTLLAHGSAHAEAKPVAKLAANADASLLIKQRAQALAANAEKQSYCGDQPMYQYVSNYDGSLGQSIEFVNAHKNPVGRLHTSHFCSGTLISRNLFLTAGHCSIEVTGSSTVTFGFESPPDSTDLPASGTISYKVNGVVEQAFGGLDYGILELDGNPGDVWGFAVIDRFLPAKEHLITIIQHAQGFAKRVEVGHVRSNTNDQLTYDDLDTAGGSSGAGILDDDGKLVGVHTDGECQSADPSARFNYGVPMTSIYNVSPKVRMLAPPELIARYDRVERIGIQEVESAPGVPTTYGEDTDQVPAQAIVLLNSSPGAYTLPLRVSTDEATNVGMLALLRQAFVEDAVVRVEYSRMSHRSNLVLRVIRR